MPDLVELVDLEGRDPKEFKLSTHAQGALRRFAELAEHADPAAIVRGAFPRERRIMREQAALVRAWLERLEQEAGR